VVQGFESSGGTEPEIHSRRSGCKIIQILYCTVQALERAVPLELDLVSQVRDVVLMSVYLDLGNPRGRDSGMRGYMSKGGKWKV
jgi:hypothetical protein